MPGPGLIVWNELLTSDDTAASNFYAALADLEIVEQQHEQGIYRILRSFDHKRAGIMRRPADDVEPFWLTHLGVEDVAAAAAKVSELGGSVLLEPDPDFRNGLQAVAVDPGGAIFALRQWTE